MNVPWNAVQLLCKLKKSLLINIIFRNNVLSITLNTKSWPCYRSIGPTAELCKPAEFDDALFSQSTTKKEHLRQYSKILVIHDNQNHRTKNTSDWSRALFDIIGGIVEFLAPVCGCWTINDLRWDLNIS